MHGQPPEKVQQRLARMRAGFCALLLILLLGVTAMLAVGGRPDPAGPWLSLDGPWRFKAGDVPGGAEPATDDSNWDRITLVSRPGSHDEDVGIPGYLDGWRAQGHADLQGYGWYRRPVTWPAGDFVLVGPPATDDGYEMFWNGRPLGGAGLLPGPNASATRPFMARLPHASAEQPALLAIRAFMQPGLGRDLHSGGLRTVPVLAPAADGEALYQAQWRRTIAGYVVDAAEPVAMWVLAILAWVMAPALARPGFARWAAAALVATGGVRVGNAVIAWTDLLSLPTLLWLNGLVWAPFAKLAWALAWNQWCDGRDRRFVSAAAFAAWAVLIAGELAHAKPLAGAGRAIFAACLLATALRILRHGGHKPLALASMVLTATGLFAADLSALGIPGIWFPFNIGVSRSQFALGLVLPLLAFAILRGPSEAVRPAARRSAP